MRDILIDKLTYHCHNKASCLGGTLMECSRNLKLAPFHEAEFKLNWNDKKIEFTNLQFREI